MLHVAEITAADKVATPDNYQTQLATLVAGDTLTLAQGYYTGNLSIHNMAGTSAHPITIQGPIGIKSQRAVFLGTCCSNTLSLLNSQHIVIKNLYFDNNDESGPSAIKAEGHADWTHDIHIEGCIIDGYDEDQQQVDHGQPDDRPHDHLL
ncbi:MAG: hypothetical protein HRU15_08040, partial [Planctomycetes bacterium]|nr:hypothetical protein [Planctomycetota bacterium]